MNVPSRWNGQRSCNVHCLEREDLTGDALRIGYLINQYPQPSHSFIRREINALESAGHSVTRYTLRANGGTLPDAGDRAERDRTRAILGTPAIGLFGASVRAFLARPAHAWAALRLTWREGRRSDRGLLRHLVCLVEACQLAQWLRDQQIEHLHAHFGTNSATVAMLAGHLASVPYSFTVHGPEEFDRAPGLGLETKVARSKFAVAISDFGRGQLMRWCRSADWQKLRVVRCGLDASFLGEPSTPVPDVPTIVCVGRLVEQKAQLILVEAVARLARIGVRVDLRLIGDGPMRGEIEATIDAASVGDRVSLLGWRSAAEVRAEMLAARVVAQPSLAEGLPVAIMEAFALRRPVITTRIAGIPELVDASCGWVVAAGSIDQLADALADAVSRSPAELHAMGQRGHDRVTDRHRIETEASKLANAFLERV